MYIHICIYNPTIYKERTQEKFCGEASAQLYGEEQSLFVCILYICIYILYIYVYIYIYYIHIL